MTAYVHAMACGLLFGALLCGPAAAAADAEKLCGFSIEKITKMDELLTNEIVRQTAAIHRLEEETTAIGAPAKEELVSHYRALLAEAKEAERTLAGEISMIESLKSASAVPDIMCRNPNEGEVK